MAIAPHKKYKNGEVFGLWTLIGSTKIGKRNLRLAKCACGTTKAVNMCHLSSGYSKSCGCVSYAGEKSGKYKHGSYKNKEYACWKNMRDRCWNPNNRKYSYYGGRGITVCKRWAYSFSRFLKDMGPRPSPNHSIDRKNSNGNYTPNNCRWATVEQQRNNKRNNRLIKYKGRKQSLAVWCKELGVPYQRTHGRITNLRWGIAKAFEAPKKINQFI